MKCNAIYLVVDQNANTTDVFESEEEALKCAEEGLSEIYKAACDRGEWPLFDQIYVAKVSHQLQEYHEEDMLDVVLEKL